MKTKGMLSMLAMTLLVVGSQVAVGALDDVYLSRANDFIMRYDYGLNQIGSKAEGASAPMGSFSNGDIMYDRGDSFLIKENETLSSESNYNMGGFGYTFAVLANDNVVVSFQDSIGNNWLRILDSSLTEIGQNWAVSGYANAMVGLSDGSFAIAWSSGFVERYDQTLSQIGSSYNLGTATAMDVQSDDDVIVSRQGWVFRLNSSMAEQNVYNVGDATGNIWDLAVLADDKVIVSGTTSGGGRRLCDYEPQ